MPGAQVQYNPVPTVSAEGGGGTLSGVRADAADFGGQIGQAVQNAGAIGEKLGNETLDVATQAAQIAGEVQVNDRFSNQVAPAVAQVRQKFAQLSPEDQFHGLDQFNADLKKIGDNAIQGLGPDSTKMMTGMLARHITQQSDWAEGLATQGWAQTQAASGTKAVRANLGLATPNYNDPQYISSVMDQNIALRQIQGVDQNIPSEQVDENIRQDKGALGVGLINSALTAGDTNAAHGLRSQFADVIPGYQQLSIDNTLHAQAMTQTGKQNVTALTSGQPLPQTIGAPPAEVQAVVANEAHAAGVDPNLALTTLRIESSNGQNLGSRGDILQTGKGGDLQAQAVNGVKALSESQAVAQKALGRQPTGAETYLCYQQGAAGGPALLKAAQESKNEIAVNILRPFYGSNKAALSAICNNGGNATMTASDFVNLITKKFEDNFKRAAVDLSGVGPKIDSMAFQAGKNVSDYFSGPNFQKDLTLLGNTTKSVLANDTNMVKAGFDMAGKSAPTILMDDALGLPKDQTIADVRNKLGLDGDNKNYLGSATMAALNAPHSATTQESAPATTSQQQSAQDQGKPSANGESTPQYEGNIKTPGELIMAPHTTQNVAIQQQPTPVSTLKEWDAKAAQYQDAINAVPNLAVREAMQKQFDRHEADGAERAGDEREREDREGI